MDKTMKDSCKSKKCTDVYLTLIEEVKVGHQSFFEKYKNYETNTNVEILRRQMEIVDKKMYKQHR